jgi:hypothetical protein
MCPWVRSEVFPRTLLHPLGERAWVEMRLTTCFLELRRDEQWGWIEGTIGVNPTTPTPSPPHIHQATHGAQSTWKRLDLSRRDKRWVSCERGDALLGGHPNPRRARSC